MATKVNINGKIVQRPGVYTLVKSGIKNTPANLAFGNICIIDDGIGASYGGGAANTVYSFDKVQDYQNFVKGGPLWDLGAPLFKPLPGFNGVSKIFLIHARTATSATITFTITAGSLIFATKDQGLNANGVQDGGNVLRNGYAGTLEQVNVPTTTPTFASVVHTAAGSGVAEVHWITPVNVHAGDRFTYTQAAITLTYTAILGDGVAQVAAGMAGLINANATIGAIVTATSDGTKLIVTADVVNTAFTGTTAAIAAPAQFVVKLWHGSFKGTDPLNNTPYEGITIDNAAPTLLAESPIVSTLDELKTWADKTYAVQQGFTYTIGTGAIVTGDLAANTGNKLATGGTETYSEPAFQAALGFVKNLDNTFFFSTKYGVDVLDQHNEDIRTVINAGKYERFLWLGGGADVNAWYTITKPACIHYNDDDVIVVHGDGKKTIRTGYKRVSSLYKAAACLGRLCGMEPQTPLTFKQIGIDAEWEALSDDQLDEALTVGALVTYFDDELGYTVVLEDINTLQANDNLVNDDASSFNIAVKRIIAQLNKELAIFLKKKFFGNQNAGPNRNTVSTDDVNAATEGFLQSKIASSIDDNLILRFANIISSFDQDNMKVSYEVVPNFEVSKIIVTGILLES